MELNKEYTYGELTKGILNEEPKKGGSKDKQMKTIQSLYRISQEGRKYILIEKYDSPKKVIDNRQDSYIPLVENLILNLCYHESYQPYFDGSVKVSVGRIARAVGLFNSNFAECKRMLRKTSKYLGTNIDTTKEYFDTVSRSVKGKVETALKNLDESATISWQKL